MSVYFTIQNFKNQEDPSPIQQSLAPFNYYRLRFVAENGTVLRTDFFPSTTITKDQNRRWRHKYTLNMLNRTGMSWSLNTIQNYITNKNISQSKNIRNNFVDAFLDVCIENGSACTEVRYHENADGSSAAHCRIVLDKQKPSGKKSGHISSG